MTCAFTWRDGKVFTVEQTITKTDGTVAAELTAVAGLLDLDQRTLVPNPREVLPGLGAFVL